MIDPELATRLEALEQKVDAAYKAAHRTQQYLFWTGVVTVALIVLPAIGLVFAIPMFINNYVTPMNAATGTTGSVQGTLNTLNSLGL